jgi:hypothetical protein
MLFWNKNGAEAPKKRVSREGGLKRALARTGDVIRRQYGVIRAVADQIQQVAIGLLYAGSGIFRMTDFFKNGLQQHAILILLFRKQRQKTQG